jgi:hypothetical protein
MIMKKTYWFVAGAIALSALLYACGGGSGASPDSGATGASSSSGSPSAAGPVSVSAVGGTVTGFASMVIDGYEYADNTATSVAEEIDPSSPSAASLSLVQLGQHVDFDLNGGVLGAGFIRPRVVGPVATVSASANRFLVLGQTVETSATTVFGGGYGSIADVQSGNVVKVHGTPNSDGSIAATRVELVSSTAVVPGYLVVGTVASLSPGTPAAFSINQLSVTDTGATVLLPGGASLADGEVVTVFAPASAYTGTATATPAVDASVVRIHPSLAGLTVVEGGRVQAVTDTGGVVTSFAMDGFTVDTTSSSLSIVDDGKPGTLADIVVGARVVVEGTFSSSGILVASNIWIGTPQVLLAGPVYSVASTNSAGGGSFILRHTVVNYNSTTAFAPSSDSWSNLASGAYVVVVGTPGAAGMSATTITFLPVPCGVTPLSLGGDAPAGWAPPASIAASCGPSGSSGGSPSYHYAGTASAVTTTSAGTAFTLTGLDGTTVTVDVSGATLLAPEGVSIADLMNGSKVLVIGTLGASGALSATYLLILQ